MTDNKTKQSISFHVFDGSYDAGEITVDHNLHFDTSKIFSGSRERIGGLLRVLFENGVYVTERVPVEYDTDGLARQIWLRAAVTKDSPYFFEALLEMIQNAGFGVWLNETPERIALVRQMQSYYEKFELSATDRAMLTSRVPSMTECQLKEINDVFEEECNGVSPA